MKIYYKPNDDLPGIGNFVAAHEDSQNVSADVYGADTKTFDIDRLESLERVGIPIPGALFDPRPIKIPTFSIWTLRQKAFDDMLVILSTFGELVTSKYSQAEMLSWGLKEAAARAALAGETLNSSQEAILDAEQQAGGYPDRKTLADAVISKAEQFSRIAGAISGLRATTTAGIDNAKNQRELDGVLAALRTEIDNIVNGVSPTPSA